MKVHMYNWRVFVVTRNLVCVGLAFSFLCCARAAFGQSTSTVMPAPAQAAQPAGDANARALVDQMYAAYKALTSFSCVMDYQRSDIGEAVTVKFDIQKPDRVAYRRTSKNADYDLIGDGKYLTVTTTDRAALPHRYLRTPETQDKLYRDAPFFFNMAHYADGVVVTVVPSVVFGIDWIPDTAFAMGKPAVIDGETVDTVSAFGGLETFAISRTDHLLRQVSDADASVTFRDVQANPIFPADLFAFKAPRHSEGVGSVDDLIPPPIAYTKAPPLIIGQPPPTFAITDFDEKPVSMEQYKGRVVLLQFWGTWCAPCVAEMPRLVTLYEKYHQQGFDILGLAIDSERHKEQVTRFDRAHHITWRMALDANGLVSNDRFIPDGVGVPFFVLIGRDGKIAAVNPSLDELNSAIGKALEY